VKPEGNNHLEDPDVDGKIILKWIFREVGWEGKDWIDLVQNSDDWRALVNAVINLRVSRNAKNFLIS